MNTLLPVPACGRILLVVAPASAGGPMFDLVAHLALQNLLYVLDGGNTFQGYELARLLRRRTPEYDNALQRVILSRVFTCYQMEALLSGGGFELERDPHPLLVLDFLASFYDQGVRVKDRRRLLQECIAHLQRFSQRAPLVVWVRQRSLIPPEGLEFIDRLRSAAGQVWVPQAPNPSGWRQPPLLTA